MAERRFQALLAVACLSVISLSSFACGSAGEGETAPPPAGTATGGEVRQQEEWRDEGLRLAGRYADADVVPLDSGGYRMYFGAEPEVEGFRGQVYSAVSVDGLDWSMDEGVRLLDASFPEVVRLPDGRWRMYFQGAAAGGEDGIASAVSADGLDWRREEGLRIRRGQQGELDLEGVADPAVLELPGGGYLMVYRGQAGRRRPPRGKGGDTPPRPNAFLLSAVSKDGLDWKPAAVVLDSRNDEMQGQILGPDLVLEDGRIKLYCNSFAGIYELDLDEDGRPLGAPLLVVRSSGSPEGGDLFAPGDVSVVEEDGTWRMYYGLHTRGIHSMRREE